MGSKEKRERLTGVIVTSAITYEPSLASWNAGLGRFSWIVSLGDYNYGVRPYRSTRCSLISSTMSPKAAPYGTWHSPITSDTIIQNVSKCLSLFDLIGLCLTTVNFRLAGDQDRIDLHRPRHILHLPHRSSSQRRRQMRDRQHE